MSILNSRESRILTLLRLEGPKSRRELHARLRLRPNTVGDTVAALIKRGLLRQNEPGESGGPGRPRQPLEIDLTRRHVVGLAFEPGRVSACLLNLHGQRIGPIQVREVPGAHQIVAAACSLVHEFDAEPTLAIGASVTGFVDLHTLSILTSSATMQRSATRLDALYAAAGHAPLLLENDMHALASYWRLNQHAAPQEDVLLIDLRDGAVGAALLIAGRPNRGCITGGNELGHTRFPVETEVCYCGHQGCLERIFSSTFLRRLGGDPQSDLYERLSQFHPSDAPLNQISGYLAMAIANAINFIRPNSVVITGPTTQNIPFSNHLLGRVRNLLLAPLAERVRIDLWHEPAVAPAEAAGWLALADIYRGSDAATLAELHRDSALEILARRA
jgi:N-acetylglucosamine repressor